jgi:hypothetical protein
MSYPMASVYSCWLLLYYFHIILLSELMSQIVNLKVPKREIFNRWDFPDFNTMKSLRVGDFGVKIKKILKIFRGSFRGAKFLTRMLSLFLRRFFSKFLPKKIFFLWRF